MPKLDTNRRVSIDVAGGTVTFICRTPSASEQSKFLNSRFATKRNKVETRVYAARAEFMDQITVDVEGVTYVNAEGAEFPLNAAASLTDADKAKWTAVLGVTIKSFRDLIPLSWKSSAAQRFEDSNNSDSEDEAEPAKN
jgi:hypothetical protein